MKIGEAVEANKQLVGIRIIIILSIILYSIIWISGMFRACDETYYYGAGSGFGVFMLFTIFFGGFLTLSIIGLIGLNQRKTYAIPVNRAVLILFSFWTGFIPVGLILILVFWSRFKDPLVKRYLNYGYSDEDTNRENYKYGVEDATSKIVTEKNIKYCIFCGQKLPSDALFCKKCGKRI